MEQGDEAMKATKDFQSMLGPAMRRYVELKEALGLDYFHQSRVLQAIDRFLCGIEGEAIDLTQATFRDWCASITHLASGTRRRYMQIVRNFCLYRRRTNPTCFVPNPVHFPFSHQRVQPYIFKESEILGLLAACRTLPRYFPLRPEVFHLGIVLLYTSGLRIGELLRLTAEDYDAKEQTLFIRQAKFHKSRYVPLSSDAAGALDRFLHRFRCQRNAVAPDVPFIWNGRKNRKSYTATGFSLVIKELLNQLGIRKPDGRRPRIQDYRHSFAVHALLRWYRSDVDVQAKLPILSTYMGHVSIASTQYYLPFIESLSQEASIRFEKRCGRLVTTSTQGEGGSK
jgi:integrase/recombinase XerD